jgi:hypothetical protein
MGNVKYRPMEQVSGWLEYALESDKLEPPVFRCRVKPVDMFNLIDGYAEGETMRMGKLTLGAVVDAIVEWDLCVDGTPIPLTPENKMEWLRPIIADQVKDRGTLLGVAILQDARNRDNFLKN